MALRQRQQKVGTTILNDENLTKRHEKLVVTKRPALGEVGNKLRNQERQNNVLKKPLGLGVHNVNAKSNTTKINDVKVTQPENIPQKRHTLIRQESTFLKNTLQIPRDHKIELSYSTQQLGVTDIDASDKNDPFLVSEYVQDIYTHLQNIETDYQIRKHYLKTHRSTSRMRCVLVNWLVDVHASFKLVLETLHVSIGILDRYLQINNIIGRDTLQLAGVTALFIASKYEEMYMPNLEDFESICDNTYTRSQILKMELDILTKLKWNVGRPLSIHFLRRYNKIAREHPETHSLGKYMLELCLLDYELCHFNPSLQAAAACFLSSSIMNDQTDPAQVWTKALVHYTSYKYCDIKPVVVQIARFIFNIETCKFQSIRKKYAGAQFKKISVHYKLKGRVIKELVQENEITKKF